MRIRLVLSCVLDTNQPKHMTQRSSLKEYLAIQKGVDEVTALRNLMTELGSIGAEDEWFATGGDIKVEVCQELQRRSDVRTINGTN